MNSFFAILAVVCKVLDLEFRTHSQPHRHTPLACSNSLTEVYGVFVSWNVCCIMLMEKYLTVHKILEQILIVPAYYLILMRISTELTHFQLH